ncbi:SRPBCC family protein [Neisseriaceae bacterium JH1-16]|nr:SRPBCC family protein [Neisseriaceae bacterium JH1-16]
MAEYCLTTRWRVEAPLEVVWEAIYHADRWPAWWPGVEAVHELLPGDDCGIGAVHRYTWKSVLPYRLSFDIRVTRIERLVALEGVAYGELAGRGCWQFTREGGLTVVRYDWQVTTAKRWMNWLAPLARPLFRWNHDVVMRAGGRGLARLLNARLLED